MMNPTRQHATPYTVAVYLTAAYEVDEATAKRLVDANADMVRQAAGLRSMAYYPGDQIATAAGLVEREDFDPDEDEESEDDA